VAILDISNSTDARLAEVRKLLAHIKRLEATASAERDSVSAEAAMVLRGLFVVQLYGVLEYAMTLSVQVLLQEITRLGVPFMHFEQHLFTVALDSEFRSIVDSGWNSKFAKRKNLLQKQVSGSPCTMNDTVFHDQLQNIWFGTLKNVFECLCIPAEPVPERRIKGYIDEIVDARNEVAHGRSSATMVGRTKSSAELEERMNAIAHLIDYIIMSFDSYLTNREFVRPSNRNLYQRTASSAPSSPTP
jgi:hypothetical protein